MLKIASRTRSAVGRVAAPRGAERRCPPTVPAMIRIGSAYSTAARARYGAARATHHPRWRFTYLNVYDTM
jgi:hypothetical protein